MQLPKLILGAAILFWGWQTGLWFLALPIALLYELSFFLPWRWHFKTIHFRYCSNFCTLLLVGVIIYLWNNNASLRLIFLFFQWLPFICFPLLIAQAYSDSKGIDIRALLFLKEKPNIEPNKLTLLSLHYPFLAICLIAASAGNTRDITFYLGVVLFSSIALWFVRSPRTSAIAWIGVILLASTLGFFGHLTLHYAHLSLERKTGRWMRQFYHYHSSNPNQRSTAIGDIGSLKLSNKIILRVKPSEKSLEPRLLRRITYNNYINGLWVAVKSDFKSLNLQANMVSLLPANKQENKIIRRQNIDKKSNHQVTIYRFLEEGENILNLPDGTKKIEQLPVDKIARNQYGAVKVESQSGLAAYRVTYDLDIINDSPPTKEDLEIPATEFPALQKILKELDLQNKSEKEAVNAVYQFFNTEFNYSLEFSRQGFHKTPLAAFLLAHRSGHCEYFATATALLLRATGIPTRYAIGYSVHEYSDLEQQFIVREKNAHAWNLVYINGAWQQLDTTPISWRGIESNNTSKLVILRDLLSLIGFKLAQFSGLIQALSQTKYFWLVMTPTLLILMWWLSRKRQMNGLSLERVTQTDCDYILIGVDSEIYLIERALQESDLKRNSDESWQQWISKIQKNKQLTSNLIVSLNAIIQLHYRYRFDPQGLTKEERNKLKLMTESWLTEYRELTVKDSKQINE